MLLWISLDFYILSWISMYWLAMDSRSRVNLRVKVWKMSNNYVTVKPGLYESQGTAENIRITQTFGQLRLSMYRRGFRRDRAKNSYNPRFRTIQIRITQVWLYFAADTIIYQCLLFFRDFQFKQIFWTIAGLRFRHCFGRCLTSRKFYPVAF